jgi:hypothetical protein
MDMKPRIIVNFLAFLRAEIDHFAKLFYAYAYDFGRKAPSFNELVVAGGIIFVKAIILIKINKNILVSNIVNHRMIASEPYGYIQGNGVEMDKVVVLENNVFDLGGLMSTPGLNGLAPIAPKHAVFDRDVFHVTALTFKIGTSGNDTIVEGTDKAIFHGNVF